MLFLKLIGVVILSYLIGSITFGDIAARIKKVDLRSQGSGNVGATNVFRTIGKGWGVAVLIGDALKGALAVWLGSLIGKIQGFDPAIITGIMAIFGHSWTIFARFKGGKGVATSLGVAVALVPLSSLVALGVWVAVFLAAGYVSLASVSAAISFPVAVYLFYNQDPYRILFALVIAILVIYKHRDNIKRLLNGTEHRIIYNNQKGKEQK
ncbi:MAG: glycerol-3-phosphate 1-O-acyltransferase PlsY [Firmicutes bacterium]|nr:glycerol-3-phosphate 1-O-acyltransferase PlsY [Bacillota bacterium]